MNCLQMRDHITLYLSDDLSSQDTAIVQTHLKTCDSCQAYHADMREMMDDLQHLHTMDVPSGSLSHLQAKVMTTLDAPSTKRAWLRPSLALGTAALVAIVIGVSFVKNIDSPAPSEWTQALAPESIVTREKPNEQTATKRITLAATTPEKAPPLIVKLYTNDPDIVIYWFGD